MATIQETEIQIYWKLKASNCETKNGNGIKKKTEDLNGFR